MNWNERCNEINEVIKWRINIINMFGCYDKMEYNR